MTFEAAALQDAIRDRDRLQREVETLTWEVVEARRQLWQGSVRKPPCWRCGCKGTRCGL